jgi:hypothetical protein
MTTIVDVLFRVEHGVVLSHNAITGTPQRIFASKASRRRITSGFLMSYVYSNKQDHLCEWSVRPGLEQVIAFCLRVTRRLGQIFPRLELNVIV